MTQSGYLYFHSPCFDGIVSAALIWDFLEATEGWTIERPTAVNYNERSSWLGTQLNQPCAIVDFLYHPDAEFWADHHLTTFLTEESRRDFERQRNDWLVYDEQSGSCASLLWKHLADPLGHRNSRFGEMVSWAEKIDSASYESVQEAIFGEAPALRVSASLALNDDRAYCEQLVRDLRVATLDHVAESTEVTSRCAKVRALIRAGLERLAASVKLEDDIIVFDVDASDVIINRYSPYYFYPQARYSAGIVRFPGRAKITAMRNPWREFPSVYLGKMFERDGVGGGGHQRVGSVLLAGDRAEKARSILESLVHEIQQEDAVINDGVPA